MYDLRRRNRERAVSSSDSVDSVDVENVSEVLLLPSGSLSLLELELELDMLKLDMLEPDMLDIPQPSEGPVDEEDKDKMSEKSCPSAVKSRHR
jgi:hypothetical protein